MNELTLEQRLAVESRAPKIATVAGPGSGKTRVVVARVAALAERGIPAERIALLTFTNAAAAEFRSRLPEGTELGFGGTLHAFALRMLQEFGEPWGYGPRITLLDEDEAHELIVATIKSLGVKSSLEAVAEAKRASALGIRRKGFDPAVVVVSTYQELLRADGLVDFDGLLSEFARLLKIPEFSANLAGRFSAVFLDEAQDASALDWTIYRLLPVAEFFAVGDPDQSIYGFRGACPAEFLRYTDEVSVETLRLVSNFRSHSEITRAATGLIGRNSARIAKPTISIAGPGGAVVVLPEAKHEAEEVDQVDATLATLAKGEKAPRSIAILARTNAIAETFRVELRRRGVALNEPKRTRFAPDWGYARAYVNFLVAPDNDTHAYFYAVWVALKDRSARPLSNDNEKAADAARRWAHEQRRRANAEGKTLNALLFKDRRIERSENIVPALAGMVTKESLALVAEVVRTLGPGATPAEVAAAVTSLYESNETLETDGITVGTIHSAKGREFDAVFLVGLEDQILPGVAVRLAKSPEATAAAIEEERRLLFVGVTRARRFLVLSSAAVRSGAWGGPQPRTRSRFVEELLCRSES